MENKHRPIIKEIKDKTDEIFKGYQHRSHRTRKRKINNITKKEKIFNSKLKEAKKEIQKNIRKKLAT